MIIIIFSPPPKKIIIIWGSIWAILVVVRFIYSRDTLTCCWNPDDRGRGIQQPSGEFLSRKGCRSFVGHRDESFRTSSGWHRNSDGNCGKDCFGNFLGHIADERRKQEIDNKPWFTCRCFICRKTTIFIHGNNTFFESLIQLHQVTRTYAWSGIKLLHYKAWQEATGSWTALELGGGAC